MKCVVPGPNIKGKNIIRKLIGLLSAILMNIIIGIYFHINYDL